MTPEELKARTKRFALRIIRLVDAMPRSQAGRMIVDCRLEKGEVVSPADAGSIVSESIY